MNLQNDSDDEKDIERKKKNVEEKEEKEDMDSEEEENEEKDEKGEEENEQDKEEEEKKKNTLSLQLGDVIRIEAPKNEMLNNIQFIIDYIDSTKLKLIGTKELNSIKLRINEDGTLGDGSITTISLLYRNDKLGYARQNGLISGVWVNIYFGGDTPTIITGEITNVEEDMIEIKTFPDSDIIYINFGYKGIPEDLPIDTIEIREKPEKIPEQDQDQDKEKDKEKDEESEKESEESKESTEEMVALEEEDEDDEDIVINIPLAAVKDTIREFIIRADEIHFGEELETITQLIDVESGRQRYNIDAQTGDLLDEMLSQIPNVQRTSTVLNNIHIMIERFKQLRSDFSELDEHNNVLGMMRSNALWKPLAHDIQQFKSLLYWIVPVAKNIRKVYDISAKEDTEYPDIITLTIEDDISEIVDKLDRYKSNDTQGEQNKYVHLISELNPYFTPFNEVNPETVNDIIIEKPVLNDLNIIIDNLGEFYSSIAENDVIKTKRFVIQKYNLGVSRLQSTQLTGSKMIAHRVNITQPDLLSLKSIVTLPEPVIRFSTINLPGTNILDRANLNNTFINYWQILKKATTMNNILVDNLDKELDFNENKFVDKIKNYVLTRTDEMVGLSSDEIYKKFLNVIIPKTRTLFELVKKYITGKLSLVSVVSYLEPFLVYINDLTYMQYNEINKFIQVKIADYNKNFVEKSRVFALFKTIQSRPKNANVITNVIPDRQLNNMVFDKYMYEPAKNHSTADQEFLATMGTFNVVGHDSTKSKSQFVLTNSELLKKIRSIDFGNVFDTAISIENMILMIPENIGMIIDEQNKNRKDKIEDEAKESETKCQNIVIVKQYNSIEDIASDNDKMIYVDKKYDDTPYDIIESVQKEQIKMNPSDFSDFLTNTLHIKYKYSEEDAPLLTDALINGIKKVVNGNYAIIYVANDDKIHYYKRVRNQWELDNTIDEKDVANNQSMLCNFQNECIEVDKKYKSVCETYELNKSNVTQNALKEIVNQFDKKYEISKEKLAKKLKKQLDYYVSIIDSRIEIENNRTFKYNNKQYNLGVKNDETDKDIVVSPFAKLRDKILGQPDFVKRQNDIIRFAIRFTREANTEFSNSVEENIHWRYCIQTNAKLLPSFLYTLAGYWCEDPSNYLKNMELIIKDIGALSDDGDSWVDKNSGYIIRPIDFDIDEGYEEGFKINSREVMEADIGDAILSEASKPIKFITPETRIISNVVSALSGFMGIHIEDQREFIIQLVSSALPSALPSENDYKTQIEEMAKKGRALPTYKVTYNATILYLTLGAYLIGTQVSIPSIRTRKTFPGCVRSFSGFPFEGVGDTSGLKYLTCVAYKIRSATDPWSVLMKLKEQSIFDKIKSFIETYYLNNSEVTRKFEEKLEYLLTTPSDNIPSEHDLSKWFNFLPPLVPIKLKQIENISEEFKKNVLRDFKSASRHQREKILIIESKIIMFSLGIQEKIQKVVDKKKLILSNAAMEGFLENACCSENNKMSTIKYFEKEDSDIEMYNKIVNELSHIIDDINAITKAPMLFCRENTKNIYPPLSDQFNEDTIYRAFIVFCKFNSIIPLGEDLLAICSEKPEFIISSSDSIAEQIRKLKLDGKNYKNDSLLRLLQIVNRQNIVKINVDVQTITQVQKLRKVIEDLHKDNSKDRAGAGDKAEDKDKNKNIIIPPILIDHLDTILDTFDLSVTEDIIEMREFKNYLDSSNKVMKKNIISFITTNCTDYSKYKKNIENTINEFINWEVVSKSDTDTSISDDTTYNSINFVKNYMQNMLNIFPAIIMNKVDYKNIKMPKYWGLSTYHEGNIRTYIKDYYEKLRVFYDNSILYNILTIVQQKCKNLILLADATPYLTKITYKGSNTHSIFDKRTSMLLFENYLLQALTEYTVLANDDKMVSLDVDVDVNTAEHKGNKKQLRNKTANLLVAYLNIMSDHKDVVDLTYDKIMDNVFKSKEREKDTFTDKLEAMTDEERNVDTMLKINKLGAWGKGLQKGLTTYVPESYDADREYMEKIGEFEKNLKKNKNITDNNIDQYLDDLLDDENTANAIDDEEYDMSHMTEDYMNGDDTGQEEENYDDYN